MGIMLMGDVLQHLWRLMGAPIAGTQTIMGYTETLINHAIAPVNHPLRRSLAGRGRR